MPLPLNALSKEIVNITRKIANGEEPVQYPVLYSRDNVTLDPVTNEFVPKPFGEMDQITLYEQDDVIRLKELLMMVMEQDMANDRRGMYISKTDFFYALQPHLKGGLTPEPTEEEKKAKRERQYREYKNLLKIAQCLLRRPQIELWIYSENGGNPKAGRVFGSVTWKQPIFDSYLHGGKDRGEQDIPFHTNFMTEMNLGNAQVVVAVEDSGTFTTMVDQVRRLPGDTQSILANAIFICLGGTGSFNSQLFIRKLGQYLPTVFFLDCDKGGIDTFLSIRHGPVGKGIVYNFERHSTPGATHLGPRPSDLERFRKREPGQAEDLPGFTQEEKNRLREYLDRPYLEQHMREMIQEIVDKGKKISLQQIPNRFKFIETKVGEYLNDLNDPFQF